MPADLRRFALLALECVHREYPNKIAHHLNADADVKPPRELTRLVQRRGAVSARAMTLIEARVRMLLGL